MTMVLGTNGTGKSTIMRTILQKCNAKKALIVTNHIEEWRDIQEVDLSQREDFIFEGIRKTRCYQPTKGDIGTLAKLRYFRKGIIIFDDARLYMKDAKTDNLIEDLMISYRQQELDIFVVAHGFTKVRPVFYSMYLISSYSEPSTVCNIGKWSWVRTTSGLLMLRQR
jgi:ABC-type Mn2+/Zn2+ transport system ATPase subunit